MGKIAAAVIIADFRRMLEEKWRYSWTGSETGLVSCAGAIVWSYRQHGMSIYHGSNRIAREYCEKLVPVGAAELEPGMAVFKVRRPGEKHYNLPAAYKPGQAHYNGDLNDYYHIGILDSDKKHVLNAQSTQTGFVRSPLTQNWAYAARLKDVDYGGEAPGEEAEAVADRPVVVWSQGGKVNLRKEINGALIDRYEPGTQAVEFERSGMWSHIRIDGKTGWMMNEFLRDAAPSGGAAGTIEERLAALERRVAALEARI